MTKPGPHSPSPGAACLLTLLLGLGAFCPARAADTPRRSPLGIWQGSIQGMLRIVVHVESAKDGGLTGSMDSPDQGAAGLPIDTMVFAGDSLRFTMTQLGGEYRGVMDAEGTKIAGTWTQSGQTLPLNLERQDHVAPPSRPQEPKKPYPYAEDTVRVVNRQAGSSLAGTLTTPRGKGPFPCAILVTGSGPEDRDETVFGHKPFLVLADHLTRHGIAVLRMDDRGVAASSGSYASATTADFATDIAAACEFLKTRKAIDAARIGLIGHSEGGLIAPLVAVGSKAVAFVVLMAGPGVRGDSVLVLQVERAARAEGAPEATIAAEGRMQARLFQTFLAGPDSATVTANVRKLVRERLAGLPEAERQGAPHPDSLAEQELRQLRSPWMRYFLTYDPRPTLQKVRCPVLAVNGSKDVQVAPKENLGAIEAALKAGGNRDYVVKELVGLNHLFQTATTGAVSEYMKSEETMAPAALEEITRWIAAHTAR